MKKVLCFGDSNTFGFIPENQKRYDKNTRWSGILQDLCTDKFKIVEAGCNNRTAFQNNPLGAEFTGFQALPKYLDDTFDIVILSLGINDTQKIYNTTYKDIEQGIENLILLTKTLCPKAEIILISPAKLNKAVLTHHYFSNLFDENSIEKSFYYSEIYEKIAEKNSCKFIDWDKLVTTSNIDGLHFSEDSHKKIALNIFEILTK